MNTTSQNFFANISAIPEKVRDEYLQKILKRKNAAEQKNVKLIKIIYSLIDEEKSDEWSDEKICVRLKISRNMLYWYKSVLLENLRKFYFGWEAIEEKEFSEREKLLRKTKNSFALLKLTYEKNARMYEIGMRHEAKSGFLVLAKNIEKSIRSSANDKKEKTIILSFIYTYLIRYYHSGRKTLRFNLYFNKLKKISDGINTGFTTKEKAGIEMRRMIAISLKTTFRTLSSKDYKTALKYLFKAYKLAKISGDIQSLFYITIFIDDMSSRIFHADQKTVSKCIKESYSMAVNGGNEIEILTFKILLLCFEFETRKIKTNKYYLNTARQIYESSFKLARSHYHGVIQGLFIRLLGQLGSEEEFFRMIKISYYTNILESSTYAAWWRLYVYQNLELDRNSYTWKIFKSPSNGINLPIIDVINYSSLMKLNKLVTEALTQYKNIFSFLVYSAIYQGIIISEFFTVKDGNYKRALLFIKKMEKMEKVRLMHEQEYLDLIKIGISMIEQIKRNTEAFISGKYKAAFTEVVDKIIQNGNGSILVDRYAIVIYIAQITNLSFMWEIAENFFLSIKKLAPNEINALLKVRTG